MENKTLKATLSLIRQLASSAKVSGKQGRADFLTSRLHVCGTEPDLLSFVQKLAGQLQSELQYVGGERFLNFMTVHQAPDAPAVLAWLRENTMIAAMICTLKREKDAEGDFSAEIDDILNEIEISGFNGDTGTALPAASSDAVITVRLLSPLAHGSDQKAGNNTLFRRMQVLSTTGGTLSLPFYAGNAFRGQMRDLLADHYLTALGLAPRKDDPPCRLWFFHALYAGGALEENSKQAKTLAQKLGGNGAVKAEGVHELRDIIPPLSVLGTALGNRVLSGRVNVCDFRPVCREWGTGEIPVHELFEWTFLTRREDYENHEAGKNSAMIANTETLKAGTTMIGGIDISDHATEIERSCIGKGLELMQAVGFLGAENRRGLGQAQIYLDNAPDGSRYDEYLAENRLNILTYLEDIGAINASGELNFGGDSAA